MENAEEIFNFLEDFSKRKPKTIPQELNDYLAYVARTGDPVYQWSLVRPLFKEKLVSVITDFYESSPPGIEIPSYPNVDPFNYDSMKNALLERLDSFASAPFTVQRLCELLTFPRKQYNRVDKFMRAIEKNILVVSTREPGIQRHPEPENGDPIEPIVNGSDNNSEYNVDVEMEDMSWKDNTEQQQSSEPQPGSSDSHISVDDIEARLKAKQDTPDIQDKTSTQYESVTPPELNINTDEHPTEIKTSAEINPQAPVSTKDDNALEASTSSSSTIEEVKTDIEMKEDTNTPALIIPEIIVDDAEMTEQRLKEQSAAQIVEDTDKKLDSETKPVTLEPKTDIETQSVVMDESSSDSTTKEDVETKLISEVSTSSEESSSSSDNTDGNSNSPKADDKHSDVQEESNESDSLETASEENNVKESEQAPEKPVEEPPKVTIEPDNYSISDVNSELPQPPAEGNKTETEKENESKEPEKIEETKCESAVADEEPTKIET